MISLESRVALITGAGGGIGRGIARAFAAAGANIIIVDVDPARVADARSEIESGGSQVLGLAVDVTVAQQVADMMRDVEHRFGKLDILVNNVGAELGERKTFAATTEAEWDWLYSINLRHIFLVTQAAIPLLRRQGRGSIINLSTIEAFRGIPLSSVYSAFKSAIHGFTRSLALELARDGIRVNAIAPETTASCTVDIAARMSPEHLEEVGNWIPLGRFGRPDDIAGGALFLASDLSAWMTGTTLHMDGGALAAGAWVRMPAGGWTHRPLVAGSAYRHHRNEAP
jgi:3-oxoacyl-[acyl-carrier protein] reductase